MPGIEPFSSRRLPEGASLGSAFLVPELAGADSYRRIAGYFCSSIVDVAGEELDGIVRRKGCVRVVCNAKLDFVEGETAGIPERALDEFLWMEWGEFKRERSRNIDRSRFARLHALMKDGFMEVRVLYDGALGLLHGKAGLVSKNGNTRAFIGSANESLGGWKRNYELVAASDDQELVSFVGEEFEALWAMAAPLPPRIVDDFGKLANRAEIGIDDWRKNPDPGHVLTGSMVSEITPMDYQKWFIDLCFRDHRRFPWGARYVLADPVGLGKTIQMGMAMKLMALWSRNSSPLLVIVPKTLVVQWQEELLLMGMPSAYWDSGERRWICEDASTSERMSSAAIPNCPRRVGIVSSGLISNRRGGKGSGGNPFEQWLLDRTYECVVVDEAHRARRHVLAGAPYAKGRLGEQRHLIRFLRKISEKTKSMLMGTATPIQIHPIELWDLLDVLSQGNSAVMGTHELSKWSADPETAISFLSPPKRIVDFVESSSMRVFRPDFSAGSIRDPREKWEWLKDPLPFPRVKSDGKVADSDIHFEMIRRALGLSTGVDKRPVSDSDCTAPGGDPSSTPSLIPIFPYMEDVWGNPANAETRAASVIRHTPFVRRVVRRSRKQLEDCGILKEIRVRMYGEKNPLPSPSYLVDAFQKAQEFCATLSEMPKGFIQTLLLRRLGSSKTAGLATARRMLENWSSVESDPEEDDDSEIVDDSSAPRPDKSKKVKKGQRTLNGKQRGLLEEFVSLIECSGTGDPKLDKLVELLEAGDREQEKDMPWLQDGVIVFSQYYDTAVTFARKISERFPNEMVAVYAGAGGSRLINGAAGTDMEVARDKLKQMAKEGRLRLIFGTDAASEGLNLQMFGALVNLDLPWNPTRLEQRKGRIQRPGQKLETIRVFNMRYKGSVEDDVHNRLSERLEQICSLLGQVPDCLEAAWISAAHGKWEEAEKLINGLVEENPMQDFYDDELVKEARELKWDECGTVLGDAEAAACLRRPWG